MGDWKYHPSAIMMNKVLLSESIQPNQKNVSFQLRESYINGRPTRVKTEVNYFSLDTKPAKHLHIGELLQW